MSVDDDNSILEDLFHGCALAAFLEEAHARQGWPDSEATRRRAYRLYEDALAERNGGRSDTPKVDMQRRCSYMLPEPHETRHVPDAESSPDDPDR